MKARTKAHAGTILSAGGIVNRFGDQLVHDRLNLDIVAGEIIGKTTESKPAELKAPDAKPAETVAMEPAVT